MKKKLIVIFLTLMAMTVNLYAADDCLDVFPAATNGNSSDGLTPLVSNGTIKDESESNNVTLTLAAGQNHDYDSIKLKNGFILNVSGTGTARWHFTGNLEVGNNAKINEFGNPEDLVIYLSGNVIIGNGAIINALIYTDGNIEIGNNGTTTGALSANGNIILGSHNVVYDIDAVGSAEFAGMCNAPAPVEPDITIDDLNIDSPNDAIFTVSLTQTHTENITIDYSSSNGTATAGSDYTAVSGTVTINQGDTQATITVSTLNGGSGTFTVSVSNASAGNITDAAGVGTISDPNVSCVTFRDEFSSSSYSRQDGTANWATNWDEINDNDNPDNGDIDINGSELRFDGDSNATIEREINLSSYTSATLSFDYRETGNWESSDDFDVYVSEDGGSSWVLFHRFSDDQAASTQSKNILSYLSSLTSNFRVRFSGNTNSSGEKSFIDNVEVETCSSVSAIDHYAISQSGTALTCEPITVTISGHDTGHSLVAPGAGTSIDLSTSTGAGLWSNPSEGSVVDSGGGNATYTFGASDTATLSFNHFNPGTVTFDVNFGSSPREQEEPTVTFVDTGFRFVDVSNSSLGVQTSAKTSSTLSLQAVTISNTNTCVGIFPNGASADIGFAAECINPSTCVAGTQLTTTYNSGTTSFDVQNDGASPVYNTTLSSMTFGTDSKAAFTINYPDAGQLQLHAQYEVLDGSGAGTGQFIDGSSAQFVVKPAGLCLLAEDMDGAGPRSPDCGAGNDTCNVYMEVDGSFNLQLSARAWVNDSESNTDFCDNAITPNFILNNIPISSTVVAPGGGSNGNLTPATMSIDSAGTTTQSVTQSEVGVFTFTAAAPSYIGQTIANSRTANVGRFIPDHFIIENDSLVAATGSFSYLGQAFTAQFDIRAVDSFGNTTTNYRDAGANNDFVKLSIDADISYGAVNDSAGTPIYLSTRLSSAAALFSWGSGLATLVQVPLTLNRDISPDGPFSAAAIGLVLTDSDGISLLAADLDLDTEAPVANDKQQIDSVTTDFRYGRSYIPPLYGPEISVGDTTPISFEIQFYNGTTFEINTLDSSSTYGQGATMNAATLTNYNGNLSAGDLGSGDINFPNPGVLVSSGAGDQTSVNRPGAGNDGSVEVSFDVDSWLRFDWDGVSSDDNPSATFHFGTYRGHDRIIYWREVHNP